MDSNLALAKRQRIANLSSMQNSVNMTHKLDDPMKSSVGTADSSNIKLTSIYHVKPYVNIHGPSPRQVMRWTNTIKAGTLVLVRTLDKTLTQMPNSSQNARTNRNAFSVDMLSVVQLNFVLHQMMVSKLKPFIDKERKLGVAIDVNKYNDAMMKVYSEVMIEASMWQPVGFLVTPPDARVTVLPEPLGRTVVVTIQGPMYVNNIWGEYVKNYNQLFLRLAAGLNRGESATIYRVDEGEMETIPSLGYPFMCPRFEAIMSKNHYKLYDEGYTFPVYTDSYAGAVVGTSNVNPRYHDDAIVYLMGTCLLTTLGRKAFYNNVQFRDDMNVLTEKVCTRYTNDNDQIFLNICV